MAVSNMPHSSESLQKYRASLAGAVTLSAPEERRLAIAWKSGDASAGDRLIKGSLPFVMSVALEYRRWGVPLEDLIQQGNLGLLKAAKKFDTDRECRLITYAVYWIRAEIREYVVRAYRVVRIGTTKAERRALRAYRKTKEDNPTALAEVSGLSVDQAERLLPVLRGRETSLDATYDGEAPVDRLADQGALPDDLVAHAHFQASASERVHKAIDKLPPREAMIIRERLLADDPVTLEELGLRLGISKERVRQLEVRARGILKENLQGVHSAA